MKQLLIIGMIALMLLPIATAKEWQISEADRQANKQVLENMAWRFETFSRGDMQRWNNAWQSQLFRQHWDYVDEVFDEEQAQGDIRPDLADMRYSDGRQYQFCVLNDEYMQILAESDPCKEARVDQGIHTCS